MCGYWTFQTRRGIFAIIPEGDRFILKFESERLGSYWRPEQAADDAAGGHFSGPMEAEAAASSLPDELSDWTFTPSR